MNKRTGLVLLAGLGSAFFVFLHDRYSVSISSSSPKFSEREDLPAREIASPRNRTSEMSPPPSTRNPDQKGLSPADYASLSQEQVQAFLEASNRNERELIAKRQKQDKELSQLLSDPRSIRFENESRVFRTLPTLFAVPEKETSQLAFYEVWKKEFGFAIYKIGEKQVAPPSALPVVRLDNGQLGILTGTVQVKSKEAPIEEWQSKLGLQFVQSFPDIQISYFKSNKTDLANLALVIDRLRKDPRVESADLQVVEKAYVPR